LEQFYSLWRSTEKIEFHKRKTAKPISMNYFLHHIFFKVGSDTTCWELVCKHVCAAESKIPKAKNELYKEQVKNNVILK
jgi:hypothetical protein